MSDRAPRGFDQETDRIRKLYDERRRYTGSGLGRGTFESRLNEYVTLFEAVGRMPLEGARILDMGCANGAWLDICCRRWGAREQDCVGVDLRRETYEA